MIKLNFKRYNQIRRVNGHTTKSPLNYQVEDIDKN